MIYGHGDDIFRYGDKIKMTYDSTTEWGIEKGEVFAVISEDDFRCKMSATSHMNYGESYVQEAEIQLVSEKVKLPTSGYDAEMTGAVAFRAASMDLSMS